MTASLYPGEIACPACGERVLFAVAAAGDLIPLDTEPYGPVVAYRDLLGLPRCRPYRNGSALRPGEERFSLHLDTCIPRRGRIAAVPGLPEGVRSFDAAWRRRDEIQHLASLGSHPRRHDDHRNMR
jgi:hypothetical protein